MYDVVVVGARCAGSPTAMLLARKGYRVLLVDRATFPSDTISMHYIHHPGVAILKGWGLVDRVAASNCPPIVSCLVDLGAPMVFTSNFDTGTVSFAGYSFQGFEPWPFGVPAAYAPRRYVLDKILLDAAAEEGVDVREGFAVQEYVVEDGRVVGVRGLTKSGATVVERAHVVVGADGLHSLLARTVGATAYRHKPPLTCAYLSYWADVPTDGLEFYHRTHRAVIAIPTNDDQVCIGLAWRHDEFQEFRRDIEGNFMRTLDIAPSLAERVRGGRRVERIVGTASLPNQFRRPYGDGWVLVGDAGYYRDPITGQGITDAFRSADLASDAIDEFLSGSKGYDDAMSGYEERRNAVSMPMYDVTCRLAALDTPSPESMQLYAAFGEWKAPVP